MTMRLACRHPFQEDCRAAPFLEGAIQILSLSSVNAPSRKAHPGVRSVMGASLPGRWPTDDAASLPSPFPGRLVAPPFLEGAIQILSLVSECPFLEGPPRREIGYPTQVFRKG
ncbi:MAG: hypothetical protein R2867_19855 [Caldilineaceae bacterium]